MEIIVKVAVNYPLYTTFDYVAKTHHKSIVIGSRVKVSFGNKDVIGIVIDKEKKTGKVESKFRLKNIKEVIDDSPVVNDEILNLCQWASNYYQYPLGQIIFSTLPTQIKRGIKKDRINIYNKNDTKYFARKEIMLNHEQEKIYKNIKQKINDYSSILISGITGSGKTELYIKISDEIIKKKGQILIIVPEINLTPQTIDRFQEYIKSTIYSYHSSLTDKEKMTVWKLSSTNQLDIVIGTRSSIFLPFDNLKLIVVDEEHDSSLKQQEKFKYHARDLAIIRAKKLNIPIIIGSATPSFESIYNSIIDKSIKYKLTKRYFKTELPKIVLVDLNKDTPNNGISGYLAKSIKQQLKLKKQVILFIGRRGFSHALTCKNCKWISKCKRCTSFMTYHRTQKNLKCHHCGSVEKISPNPGDCQSCDLVPLGYGTQRIEDGIKKLFPTANVSRIDSDSVTNIKKLKQFINQMKNKEIDILIGTQMIAKGHDFPNVSLVGIIDVDSGLYSTDFRGLERTAQLITQVSGRSGRKSTRGHVILQTRNPDHPLLKTLLKGGYEEFSRENLKERQASCLPPYSHISLVKSSSIHKNKSLNLLNNIRNKFSGDDRVFVFGPAESPIGRRGNVYHHQIMFGSKNRSILNNKTRQIREYIEEKKPYNVRWSIDIDPIDFY